MAEKVTQKEMVKKALDNGVSSPGEIVAFIKREFNVDMTNTQVSVVKSTLGGGGGKKGRPKGTTSVVQAQPQVPMATVGVGQMGITETIVAVQNLARQVGGTDKLIEVARLVAS